MGVDIYGRRTQWTGTKPEIDWTKEHSKEAKDEFFRLTDEFKDNNPGYYFRSNWWGWRPIVMLSEIAAQNSGLDIDFKYWGANDGKGLETQEQCTALANALEELLAADGSFEHETDELYVNMGSWRDGSGMLVEPELLSEVDELPESFEDDEAELDEAEPDEAVDPAPPVAAASISEAVSHAANNAARAARNINLFIFSPHFQRIFIYLYY